ncbi:MAG TPA: hypothetical protein VJC09_00165 [Candidatus Saccharimonadales bacterium]|nr:hypothetical protein [Candidatus Saccharimonadales bacterium]
MSSDFNLSQASFDKFATGLFKYLDKRFDGIDRKFDAVNENFSQLQSIVDAYAKQVEIYHHESVSRDAKVERLERWIEQIATKTGVKLNY